MNYQPVRERRPFAYEEEHTRYLADGDGRVLWNGPQLFVDVSHAARIHYHQRLNAERTKPERAWDQVRARWAAKHRPRPAPPKELGDDEIEACLMTWRSNFNRGRREEFDEADLRALLVRVRDATIKETPYCDCYDDY